MLENINGIIEGDWPSGGGESNPTEDEGVEEIALTKIMSFSGKSITPYSSGCRHIEDLTGNGNYVTIKSAELTQDGKGLVFNGSNTYGKLFRNSTITFPLTLELSLSTTSNSANQIVWYDSSTKTVFSFGGDYFIVAMNDHGYPLVKMPTGFTDGTLKTVAITYNSQVDYDVYVNGVLQEKFEYTNYWGDYGFYGLGGRDYDYYFNGTLYALRVYDKVLSAEEIVASSTADANMINGNANNIARSNLAIEYVIKDNNDQSPTVINDQTGNGNNMTCTDITYDRYGKFFILNGSTSYGRINQQSNTNLPLTIDLTVGGLTSNSSHRILYFNPGNKIAVVIEGDNGICFIANENSCNKLYPQNSILDGNIHNIVISYTTLTDYKVYIDGIEQSFSEQTDYWSLGTETYHTIGGRINSGYNGYFSDGRIYELTMYEGAATAEQAVILNNNSVIRYH